tara:strand:- start:1205 stop:1750 length:546 start_codon:yes stop_codon:yes gene_type:complete
MSSILYSILISTEKPIFDINDNLIKAGIYILEITHFKDNGIVKGFIKNIGRENKYIVEFKYFTVIKLMCKAQSWLTRRCSSNLNLPITNSPSPPPLHYNDNTNFIEKLSCSISMFEPENKILNKNDKKECSICLGEMIVKERLFCGHFFHKKCIASWCNSSKTCPICRRSISTNKYLKIIG